MMENVNCKNKVIAEVLPDIMVDRLKLGIELLDAILSVDPNDKPALLARGSIYLRLNNAKRASSDFSRVLKIDPNHPKAYHLRGLSKEMEDNYSQALEDFNRAIDVDSDYKSAYDSRDILLTRMGQNTETKEAMKMVAKKTNKFVLND